MTYNLPTTTSVFKICHSHKPASRKVGLTYNLPTNVSFQTNLPFATLLFISAITTCLSPTTHRKATLHPTILEKDSAATTLPASRNLPQSFLLYRFMCVSTLLNISVILPPLSKRTLLTLIFPSYKISSFAY